MTWYQQLLISLSTGVVAALLTTWLALARFYRERSWQKRFDSCADVISALHDLDRMEELWLNERMFDHEYLPEYRADIEKHGEQALRSLRRYADLGPLALPASVSAAVQAFMRDNTKAATVSEPSDFVPAIQLTRQLISDALETIPHLAATSLGLRNGEGGLGHRIWPTFVNRLRE
ncbi:hypothetical protein [Sphingomonas sp. T9W2]|uniref:hypothetical protein n=1 Tax=Sphingomonas sp. T9W2 TaxID=3143183 RepID=UPI0031F53868